MKRASRHGRAVLFCIKRFNTVHQFFEQPTAVEGAFHGMPVDTPADFPGAFVLIHTGQRLFGVLSAQPVTIQNQRN